MGCAQVACMDSFVRRRSFTPIGQDLAQRAWTMHSAEHPAPGARGSISLRVDGRTRRLIDETAAVLGKKRTEFMIESARQQAIDVGLDQRLSMLDDDRYHTFVQAPDSPPASGPKLWSLLRRVLAWQGRPQYPSC